MPAPLGSPLVLPAPAPRSAPNPLSLHIPDAPTLRIAKKSVSFAPDSEIEKVKIISPLASPNMMGPDSPAGDPFGGSDYAGYDYPLGGLAPMDPRAELLGTSVSYTGFGYDSYDPHAAPAYMNGFQYAAEVEHVSSISHDVAPYDAAASPTTLGYTRQVTEQTSPQYTGFGFTPSDMEPGTSRWCVCVWRGVTTRGSPNESAAEIASKRETGKDFPIRVHLTGVWRLGSAETVSLVPDESLALAHAATELQGRWEFSGFDTGAMELWTEGEGLGGALSGKRSGDVTGRAYMGSVFKGATRKEDLCVKLLLDEQQSSFRGWYYQKAEPAAGGVWDGKLAPDVPLVRPFVGLWQVDDESEGVQVGLKLAPDPSGMVGELIIPDDEEDADEDDGGGGGGVRLMGKTPELAPVGKLRLDGGEEVLLFLDKQPFQKDRLHVWVATHDDCAMGDLFTATKCAPSPDNVSHCCPCAQVVPVSHPNQRCGSRTCCCFGPHTQPALHCMRWTTGEKPRSMTWTSSPEQAADG